MSRPSFVFFGTPEFSGRFLDKIIAAGLVPAAVVTNPDRPVGRKKIVTPPPVKTAALAWTAKTGQPIEILQPEKLDADFIARFTAIAPVLAVVFAYNKILRKNVLDIPRTGFIGIHPSFLPEYRGPSPFQTAILDGRDETGVTLYFLDAGIDSGPMIGRSEPIVITDEDTFSTMAAKLAEAGAELFIKNSSEILAGRVTPATAQPQDAAAATYTKKFRTEDGFIAEADLAAAERGDATLINPRSILRKIHAFNPEPGAWTLRAGKRIKLLDAKLEDGRLILTMTQKEGERPRVIPSSPSPRA